MRRQGKGPFRRTAGGLLAAALLLPACQTTSHPDGVAASAQALRNAAYAGLEREPGPVTLVDGEWEGAPYHPGSAVRPRVSLLPVAPITGDLDGDGSAEAAVLLNFAPGGSGQLLHLAVVKRQAGQLRNTATAMVGDRVQLRAARIAGGRIELDLVQAGPADAMCCPGEIVTRTWALRPEGGLREVPSGVAPRRLAPDALAGSEWVLREWAWGEAAPAAPAVTLSWSDGRFAGHAGCNRYFAEVKPGASPGDIAPGPVGATRMACAEPLMAVESRFLQQLSGVRRFGFMAGRLALTYQHEGTSGVMLFERRAAGSAR